MQQLQVCDEQDIKPKILQRHALFLKAGSCVCVPQARNEAEADLRDQGLILWGL